MTTATDILKIMFYQWYKNQLQYGRSTLEPYSCQNIEMLDAKKLPDDRFLELLGLISQEQLDGLNLADDAMQNAVELGFIKIVTDAYSQDAMCIIQALTEKLEQISVQNKGKHLRKCEKQKLQKQIAEDAVNLFMIPAARTLPQRYMTLYESVLTAFAESMRDKKSEWEKAGLLLDVKITISCKTDGMTQDCTVSINGQPLRHSAANAGMIYRPGDAYLLWAENFLGRLLSTQ